ncbi:MAG: hypothetical protein MJ215_01950 [Spirochaetia bacterium]|nr:hypothetical protein [Spirochaetia bacterium]
MADELTEDIVLEDDPEINDSPDLNFPDKLIKVRFVHSSETEYCEYPADIELHDRDYVICDGKYGKDLAVVKGQMFSVAEKGKPRHVRAVYTIIRKADDSDMDRYKHNQEREVEAFRICGEKIAAHKLDMKLVSAHYLLDEPKVMFFFTADNRIDFRALVKDLVAVFRVRIELRQIGVRDEAMVTGGLGVCGRGYCCHNVTDKLRAVSIKMAKDQNLSLNSMKISGACGRLLCCLAYEYDFYAEARKSFPSEGCRVIFEDKIYKVAENNILTKTVKIAAPDGACVFLPLKCFTFDGEKKIWKAEEVAE